MCEEREWVEKGETTRYFLFGVVVGFSVSAIQIFSLLVFIGVL